MAEDDDWYETEGLPSYVRFGRYIQIGGDPRRRDYWGIAWNLSNYQKAVLQVLRTLHGNAIGRIILDAIEKDVMITPRNVAHGYSAKAFPTKGKYLYNPTYKKDRGATIVMTKDASLNALRKGVATRDGVGTGTGARAVEIDFVPGTFIPGSALNTRGRTAFKPEDALLHELVHAIRIHRGQLDTRIFKGYQSVYLDKEEFLAVLVANMYRSHVGARSSGLRWQYDFNPYKVRTMRDIGGQEHDAASFTETFTPLLAALFLEIPRLFGSLAKVKCDFNPMTYALADFSKMSAAQVSKLAKQSETFKTVGETLPDWYPS